MMELKRDYSAVAHLITVSHLKMEHSLQLGTEIYELVRKSTCEYNKTLFAKDYYITNDM